MFAFKQFVIKQDRAAMKVCTDACVLGAFADVAHHDTDAPMRILDIGTGTGLLALMAAQRNPNALIDAVELDESAFEQATENAANSPFANRVRVWPGRIQEFGLSGLDPSRPDLSSPGRYHRILTNPPFYTNHLRPPSPTAARALHTDTLPFADLLTAVQRLLEPGGQWWVLLPPYQTGQLTALAKTANLHPFRQLHLHHQATKPALRLITGYSYAPGATSVGATSVGATNLTTEALFIRESDNQTYTPAFQALLRDFYLIF